MDDQVGRQPGSAAEHDIRHQGPGGEQGRRASRTTRRRSCVASS